MALVVAPKRKPSGGEPGLKLLRVDAYLSPEAYDWQSALTRQLVGACRSNC
jgi:hypothetical protein